ncbi:aspartyl-phosphate phosphatase Spo0E family protein [Brevibacillus agri]|uniref:aspartyl-phosphate phosphatase Spo0E family protein n=1 Tax=Brevibacillus TaxID=55080 RepID=UPI0002716E72|nr:MULTISPECIES: aspartyl-phosphate phosphatase Spo0E family protein [Brevibacillus]EJL41441.1 Spo0E like sporulation regulatory protein [Brevibacillus sp. CF112]MBG9567885.1 sporulation protein Spo0E [Brevibacillus agri]MBY0050803.1 aspartyl-phosphate phosphatase Spo0E family protein [Brevibacillus agri]MCG5250162.1 aspartyl-phosphate phosphatase Spo0E family protein [Brevibacillus agri]MDR9506607.1 aspartyl-phosphate phosphatase Spo0E family protein [Brevibacillus agri]
MDHTTDLLQRIEIMRKELSELVLEKGSFLHPTVIDMSQQLDEYIVKYQKCLQLHT